MNTPHAIVPPTIGQLVKRSDTLEYTGDKMSTKPTIWKGNNKKSINYDVKGEFIKHDMPMGQRKNPSPQQESNPWPPKLVAGALSTELRELMESKVI